MRSTETGVQRAPGARLRRSRGGRAEIRRQGDGYAVAAPGVHAWEESYREVRWALEWLDVEVAADAIARRKPGRRDA